MPSSISIKACSLGFILDDSESVSGFLVNGHLFWAFQMIESEKIFVHDNSLSELLLNLEWSKWSQQETNDNDIGDSPFLPDW